MNSAETGIGFRFPPESSHRLFTKCAIVTRTEQVPEFCIREVVPNKAARDMLPKNLRYIAESDFLHDTARVTLPREALQGKQILIPGIYGRALPTAYAVIPYGNIVGGIIYTKGAGLGGYILHDSYDYKECDPTIITPWGFFGHRDAENDTLMTNMLLAAGFRSALATGTVILKYDEFRSWLLGQYKDSEVLQKIVTRSLDIVKRNGDEVALYSRIGGTSERIWTPFSSEHMPQRRRAEFIRGTRLLQTEMRLFPEKYKNAPRKILRVLEKIINGLKLTPREFETYKNLVRMFFTRNNQAVLEVYGKYYTLTSYKVIALGLTHPKDIDIGTYFTQDYELINFYGNPLPNENEPVKDKDEYRNLAMRHINHHFEDELAPMLL